MTSNVTSIYRFGWWNTGLHGVTRRDDPRLKFAAQIIQRVIERSGCAALGLCEVHPSIAEALTDEASAGLTSMTSVDFVVLRQEGPYSKRAYDLSLIVDRTRLTATGPQWLVSYVSGTAYLSGAVFELRGPTHDPMSLVLCHWPAVGQGDQDHFRKVRGDCAAEVRRQAFPQSVEVGRFRSPRDLSSPARSGAPEAGGRVILAGDFNAEPFDLAITDALSGTRDLNAEIDHLPVVFAVEYIHPQGA